MARIAGPIVAVASSVLVAGCSVFGYRGGTPEPKFTVIDNIGPVTVRHYDQRLVADTLVKNESVASARDTGFRRLAGYIFGGNASDTKISMTAPVAQSTHKIERNGPVSEQSADGGWRIRFFLPADLTAASAPKPNSALVDIHEIPAADYAVLRFSGSRSEPAVAHHIATLKQQLAQSAWHPIAAPVAWFYDPPWTLPFLRRNEVAVEVARNGSAQDQKQ